MVAINASLDSVFDDTSRLLQYEKRKRDVRRRTLDEKLAIFNVVSDEDRRTIAETTQTEYVKFIPGKDAHSAGVPTTKEKTNPMDVYDVSPDVRRAYEEFLTPAQMQE